MSTFSRVYKPYTFGVWACENQHFFCTLLTFWSDFYSFRGDFWHSKNTDIYSFLVRGAFLKVYGLYTHENVDIYGWPLNDILNKTKRKKHFRQYFKYGDIILTNKQLISNKFNSFFTNIGSTQSSQIKVPQNKTLKSFLTQKYNNNFFFPKHWWRNCKPND